MGLKKGGLKACGDEGALRFQLIKAKAVYGMELCGMQETAFTTLIGSTCFDENGVIKIKKGLNS